jgi:hypothetical protein
MIENGVYFSRRRLWNLQTPWSAVYCDRTVARTWTKRRAQDILTKYETGSIEQ